MAAQHIITVGGKAYEVRLGWNAIKRLEKELEEPIHLIGERLLPRDQGGVSAEGIPNSPYRGTAGVKEVGTIFWAGLETARLKSRSRPQPYTPEEVGDLIDEMTPNVFFDEVYPKLLEAFMEAFPIRKPKPIEKTDAPPDPR